MPGLVGYDGPYRVVQVWVGRHVCEAEEEDAGAFEIRPGRVGHAPGVLVDLWEEDGVMIERGGGCVWTGKWVLGWSVGCAVTSLSGWGHRGAGS